MPETCSMESHESTTREEFVGKVINLRQWPENFLEAGECPGCGSTLNWPMPGYEEWLAEED